MVEYKTVLNKETGQLQKVAIGEQLLTKGESIDEKTLSTLHDMSKDALIELIKRVSGAMWGVGLMTKQETGEAMLLRLAIDALSTDDARVALANIREWLDRERGKPAQYIEQRIGKVGESKASELTTEQLLLELNRMRGNDQVLLLKDVTNTIEG